MAIVNSYVALHFIVAFVKYCMEGNFGEIKFGELLYGLEGPMKISFEVV